MVAAQAAENAPQRSGDAAGASLASDDDFIAARDAFRSGDAAQLEHLARRFRHSPLEPYLTYYQLRVNLETADPAAVRQFLARPEDTPLIDRLRGEWLKLLGKNQQWDAFTAEYPHLVNADNELTCYALQARRLTQEQDALSEARKLWFSGTGQPESCSVLFEAALAAGIISEQDVWQRLRLALEAGNVSLAKQLAGRLPAKQAPDAAALGHAYNDPERYLIRARLKHADMGQRTVALFALQRLAKQLPALAYRHWRKIESDFPKAEQQYFYGWLGYEAARELDPHALEWYREAGDAPLNQLQLAWRARAALRAMNWHEVWASINAMEPEQRRDKTWRYWKARALQALGHKTAANALFAALSGEYNFYGQLAAEELGSAPGAAMMSADYRPSAAAITRVEALPGIQRAIALYRMDMRTDALKEWSWAVRNFNDRQLLAAAEVARRNEMYDRAIGTAERTVQLHDFNMRYLAPYRAELEPHIRETGLDEAWVYGLMRQESRFVSQAKSGVGAAGLMQIMPATARWLARKMGMRDYRQSLLHELDTNLRLGTYYMKTVLSRFDNNPVLASAAYNAGPSRARQWRGEKPLEGAIYVETIPFDETRDYVKKVMSNTVYYAKLFGQPASSLKQRLGIIAPGDAGQNADDK
ncbi:MAG: transglycosylase SLT domain-containing protein [Sideroxydans sp.]|nr:transglycosylase SLT domain-containing protein [Sideroxydans sp.]